MAEIEVVADRKPQQNGNSTQDPNLGPRNPAAELVVNVFSAAAYGDLEKLQGFLERDGQSVSNPDGNGYYVLHWAALNNFPEIALYVIEHGGDVNATDHRKQTALHWAAVHGSIPVADVLVQNGARVEAADISGYRMEPQGSEHSSGRMKRGGSFCSCTMNRFLCEAEEKKEGTLTY